MELNISNILSIDTSGSAKSGSWAVIGTGFNDLAPTINKMVETNAWLNGGGFSNSTVVGGQIKFKTTGKRVIGDAAQDYLFSDAVYFGLGSACETQIKLERKNSITGEVYSSITMPATIVEAEASGGKAQAGTDISVSIDGNGAPTISTAYTAAQTLTVVSNAGTGAGKTSIYINPVKASGTNIYKLKVGLFSPAVGSTLGTGWATFTAGADALSANVTTGDTATVCECTSAGVVVRVGYCTITTG